MSKKLGRPYIDVHVTTFCSCTGGLVITSIAKFHQVSPRNLAEFLRETTRRNKKFSPRNFAFRAMCVSRRNAKKELFSWADLYIKPLASLHRYRIYLYRKMDSEVIALL